MELALYHPDRGYYASGRASIGRHGDFFTNVSVGSLFGRLLAPRFGTKNSLGWNTGFQAVRPAELNSAVRTLPSSLLQPVSVALICNLIISDFSRLASKPK